MSAWNVDPKCIERMERLREFGEDLARCMSLKVSPLENDSGFAAIYPDIIQVNATMPVAAVIGATREDAEFGRSYLLGPSVYNGTDPRNRLFARGDTDSVSSTPSLEIQSLFGPMLPSILVVNRATHPVLNSIMLLEIVPQVGVDVELLAHVSAVYLVVGSDSPDLPPKFKRYISLIRQYNDRIRLIIRGSCDNPRAVACLCWGLSRIIDSIEFPDSYFVDQDVNEAGRLVADLLRVPITSAVYQLEAACRRARLARAHALLMAYVKSQLPTFNRQAKQDRLADDIQSVICIVAGKHRLPVHDFPSADYIRETIRTFDFNRLKKLKESSIELINEFITIDYPRMRSVFSQDEIALPDPTPTYPGAKFVEVPRPSVSDFADAFEALAPIEGVVKGHELREHLQNVSKLPSSTLHRIWRLSDIDGDGSLSLKEYAICRALINYVLDGNPVPKKLPSTFLAL
jgi:hypothetical protein